MITAQRELADKYAQAFLDTCGSSLTISACEALQKTAQRLRQCHGALILLQLPILSEAQRHAVLTVLEEQCGSPVSLAPLVKILRPKKRMPLLPNILESVAYRYCLEYGYEQFTITSAAPLTQQERDVLFAFLTSQLSKKIRATYAEDSDLIAGVRMQSSTTLWEHSVRQQLTTIKQLFLRRELQ